MYMYKYVCVCACGHVRVILHKHDFLHRTKCSAGVPVPLSIFPKHKSSQNMIPTCKTNNSLIL